MSVTCPAEDAVAQADGRNMLEHRGVDDIDQALWN